MAESHSRDEKPPEQASEEGCGRQDKGSGDGATSSDDGPRRSLKPVAEKIGEDSGNLRRREEWYRRRSGAV